ncbi:MAG: arginase family protein [Alphaproteobacteria bacterium]|nr:arginase family protein [Alphaproteobacteria bacterium]
MTLDTTPPPVAFFGARTDMPLREAAIVLFGAPHGTPYPEFDNRALAGTADVLRAALSGDAGWADHWDFDLGRPFDDGGSLAFLDAGNLKTEPLDGPGNRERISAATASVVAAGAVPIMIGGDDSVPIPFIEALAPLGPLTVVQVDAHIDWRDERRGEKFGFSSTMRRASEMAHVERIVQVGIRGLGSARQEEVQIAETWGAEIVTAREVHRHGVEAALEHIPTGANCLITFDCDALDPSIMKAVVAPTPGGLTYTQAIDLIAGVASKGKLRAFDMIEFIPERDTDGLSAVTAARVLVNAVGAAVTSAR